MSVVSDSDIFPVNSSRFGKVRLIISLNTDYFVLGLEFDTVAGKTTTKKPKHCCNISK